MMSFKRYVIFKEAETKIQAIVENQQNGSQALDQAKGQLMSAFQAAFQQDPQGALTWLNNLYTKALPGDYQGYYSQYQKAQQGQQQQPQQGQQQPPQQGQQQQSPQQGQQGQQGQQQGK